MSPPSEDFEPLSPELVLVADEESARRARERLPLPGFVPATAATAAVEQPDPVAPEPPSLLPAPREPPPPYPRIVLDDLPPPARTRRPGRRVVLGLVALAAVGGAGYVTATHWDDTVDAPRAEVRAVQTVSLAVGAESPTTATLQQPPRTTERTKPARHAARPVTTAPAPTTTRPPPATTAPTPPSPGSTARSASVHSPRTTTTPPPAPTAPPAAPAGSFVPGRQWIWAPQPNARSYEFTIYRGGNIVFRSRPSQARVDLPRAFRWQPGAYRWTVLAVPTGAAGPIVDSSFELTAATAAAANG